MTASRSIRRPGRIVTSALVAGASAALALAGCSAGQLTQTASQVSAVPGANLTLGAIALRDLVIQYNGTAGYQVGANAPMVIRIFNSGPTTVTLTGATADKADAVTLVGGPAVSVTATPTATTSASPPASPAGSPSPEVSPSPAGSASPSAPASPSPSPSPTPPPASSRLSIQIPPQSYVLLVPGQGGYLQLTGLKEAVVPGSWVTVTFTFDNGASAPVQVPLAPPSTTVPRGTPVVPAGGEGHE